MSRILIVHYSRTGVTRRVAELLAARLGASTMAIEEPRSRAGAWGYLRSAWEAIRGREAAIVQPSQDLQAYDVVLLGTPVWAGHASSPALTFARRYGDRIDRVALFRTQGGTADNAALAELQQALHHTPLATLTVTEREVEANAVDYKLATFVSALRARLPHAAQPQAA